MNNIYVSKNLLKNLNGEAIICLLSLTRISNNSLNTAYTNFNILEKSITNNTGNRTMLKYLKNGLDELKLRSIIDYFEEDKILFVNTEKLKITADMIEINVDNIFHILNTPKIQTDNLLQYYIYLLSNINKSNMFFCKNEDTTKVLGLNNLRIIEYNKILTNDKIIYKANNRFDYCTIYSTYENMKIVDDYINNLSDNSDSEFRVSVEYNEFVKSVLIRDGFTCVCCNSFGVKLNVHHLNGYHWDIEGRVDINNAVVLCEDCHKEFHKHYGKKRNTKEQFEEFINSRNK